MEEKREKKIAWEELSLEKRKVLVGRLKLKFPSMIPIVLRPSPFSKTPLLLPQRKYLSKDVPIGQFMCTVRKQLHMSSTQALFFFIERKGKMEALLGSDQLLSKLQKEFMQEDGLLYMCVQEESTFG
jgi:hypothetical protein